MTEAPETVVVVFCTAPETGTGDRLGAAELARALVDARLAACVNQQSGVRSVYRWHGAVEEGVETLLTIKTTAARLPDLEARIRALHPYEMPEIVAVPVAGGDGAYLRWVAECVRPQDAAQ